MQSSGDRRTSCLCSKDAMHDLAYPSFQPQKKAVQKLDGDACISLAPQHGRFGSAE